ncbi:MAG: LamG domain-containing protein [Kiritimatiellae bacterium]|nr:LamG domain-containing protein [Kiritimatiellia bacterium]
MRLELRAWRAAITAALLGAAEAGADAIAPMAWRTNFAEVTETGDLRWTPRPFLPQRGETVRFIDPESGDDALAGDAPDRAWRHHPWDASATGRAAAEREADTYVFKGGTIYRGQLTVRQMGRPGAPIRLTRDPSWGRGAAILAGSRPVTNWVRGANRGDIPEPQTVWRAELDFAPRTLWVVEADGRARRIPLARHPNWTSEPEDHKAQWFRWTNDRHPFKPRETFSANDSKNLKGCDPDFVLGALIYSEFGWVMGTPYPSRVRAFDPSDGSVRFERWTGGGNAEIIFRGMRYYLEDKPQYLDDPEGEFWVARRRGGSTLYLRPPGGADPRTLRIEAGALSDILVGEVVRHLEITGLEFRWTTPAWDLDVVAWDFRQRPYTIRPDAQPAAIRFWGEVEHLRIANCRFEDLVAGIRLRATREGTAVRSVVIEDNEFRNCDVAAIHLSDGAGWGYAHPVGVLDDVAIYRNHATHIGFRPTRYERGTAIGLDHARRAHIAGNVVERTGAQAINVVGGKSATRGEVPLVRVLIQQNKAWKTMQNGNDFGGIESWQHGPVYIFNNLSHDARGQREGERMFHGRSAGFGHAYYLDGGFQHYVFNNIAWGRSNDPTSPLVNCAAFQEIIGFQNLFLNNTAWNYTVGSRRQAPEAGRNRYIGNVWQAISERVFRHAEPAKTRAQGNEAHAAAAEGGRIEHELNIYAANVFHDVAELGVVELSGRWLRTLEEFRSALVAARARVADVGRMDPVPTLRDPARGDFRLNPASAAVDGGALAFVPWSLWGVVGEWHFLPAGDDPSLIPDEHWYAKDFLTERTEYRHRPTYPLRVVHGAVTDYVPGILETYAPGALRLDPNRRMYAVVPHAQLARPFTANLATRPAHGQDPARRAFTFEGDELRTADIHRGNLLIEVVLQARGDGLVVGKQQGPGYRLELRGGRAVFSIAGAEGGRGEVVSSGAVADGQWRHLVAEADRSARQLRLYLDGRPDAAAPGPGPESLANEGDLCVGGTPGGGWLDATVDFLRIARGTLADAHTTIEELYTWQFDGPARRDMLGRPPHGRARDAGAIECVEASSSGGEAK